MKKVKNLNRAKELLDFFQLNPAGKIRKMSKGMKQKIGIVCAFMDAPDILILDEPTSGLDPLMQKKFVELIRQEKTEGKTVLMSSHIFEEVEKTCDRLVIIREGHIVAVEDMASLRRNKTRLVDIYFDSDTAAQNFVSTLPRAKSQENVATIEISGDFDALLQSLSAYHVLDMHIRSQSFEEFFMNFYGGGAKDELDVI